jgi:hypothetical protein
MLDHILIGRVAWPLTFPVQNCLLCACYWLVCTDIGENMHCIPERRKHALTHRFSNFYSLRPL